MGLILKKNCFYDIPKELFGPFTNQSTEDDINACIRKTGVLCESFLDLP